MPIGTLSFQRETVMKLSNLLLGAAAIGLLTTSFAIADDYLGGVVKSATVGGKEILTDAKGMTLYIWDKDAVGVSNCYDQCAVNWPPVMVDATTAVSGDWSLVDRKGSDQKVVAYKGMALYGWVKDKAPGDTTGDGVGGTWHTAVE
jgi:predicted lipoprotein with Yx(FWY)xxD motif